MKKRFGLLVALGLVCVAGFAACNGGGTNDTASESERVESVESSISEESSVHVHLEGDEIYSDNEGHWYLCECGEKMSAAAHVKNPMLFSDGENEWYECVVCEIKMEERAHEHELGVAYAYDTTGHWNECRVCGDKGEVLSHVTGEWLTTEDGHWKECSVCTAKIENDGHTLDDLAWTGAGAFHTQDCGVCFKTIERPHEAINGFDYQEEEHWQLCVCGEKMNLGNHSLAYVDVDDTLGVKYCACGKELGTVNTKLERQALDLAVKDGVATVNEVAIDLSGIGAADLSVVSAKFNGVDVTGVVENGVFTFGVSDLLAEDAGKDVEFTANVAFEGVELPVKTTVVLATKVLRTLSDFSAVMSTSNTDEIYGYYVLGNDIDGADSTLSGAVQIGQQAYGFRGTFDGMGHTVSNFNTGNYGIFGNLAFGSVVKNVTFNVNKAYSNVIAYAMRSATLTDVTVTVQSIVYTGWYEVISEINDSTVTNFTIEYAESVVFDAAYGLCRTYNSKSVFTNVTVKMSAENEGKVTSTGTPDGVTAEYYE